MTGTQPGATRQEERAEWCWGRRPCDARETAAWHSSGAYPHSEASRWQPAPRLTTDGKGNQDMTHRETDAAGGLPNIESL